MRGLGSLRFYIDIVDNPLVGKRKMGIADDENVTQQNPFMESLLGFYHGLTAPW